MSNALRVLALPLLLGLAACDQSGSSAPVAGEVAGKASEQTRAANADVAARYALDIEAELKNVRRGLIAAPSGQVRDSEGNLVWDFEGFSFLQGQAPDTVNPSLWRQAVLNNQAGLFKVTEGIWQLRGFDLANLTLVQGKSGWIVIDPLTARETAEYAIAFARKHLGNQPVSAVIFTHSHADHFGGALGVLSAEEARERQVPVIAPSGFMEEATSENLMMGVAMARRATYMYGKLLPRSPEGAVDTGLGKAVGFGHMGVLPPTQLISQPSEEVEVDGVRFVFHSVPGSEAPAEMTFSLPDLKAFGGAELLSQTMHNIYTLRGAKVRDSLKWSDYIEATRAQVGDAEVLFNQHHWPIWGGKSIDEFLVAQRDVYRYMHDQTVRLMNEGYTAPEIAEMLKLPESLERHLHVHGYYGTLKHNVRGIYQFYLGWFDANPANLDPLPPVEAAKGYVALAGGPDKLLAAAREAYAQGNYRWSAELSKQLVYADPGNRDAREIQAQAFEQMGYVAESAPWRNFYLTGAQELRQGRPKEGVTPVMMLDLLAHTETERFLDVMATKLRAEDAKDLGLRIALNFSDNGERYLLWLENSVLHHRRLAEGEEVATDAGLTLTKGFFLQMVSGQAGAKDLLTSDDVSLQGSTLDLAKFFGLLGKPDGTFPIVTREF